MQDFGFLSECCSADNKSGKVIARGDKTPNSSKARLVSRFAICRNLLYGDKFLSSFADNVTKVKIPFRVFRNAMNPVKITRFFLIILTFWKNNKL